MLDKWFWNLYALCYDALNWLVPYQQMVADVIATLNLQPRMRILDIGCGTGNLEVALHATGIPLEVEAVDYSRVMLYRATRKNTAPGFGFHQLDITAGLPYDTACFDAVICNNVLYAQPQQAAVIAEMKRVLKPGGRLIISDPRPDFRWGAIIRAHACPRGLHGIGPWALHFTRTLLVLFPLLLVALANAHIEMQGQRVGYHYHTADEFEALVGSPITHTTYADQNWLLYWERG
jgi:SAM-dependent methyltransferase